MKTLILAALLSYAPDTTIMPKPRPADLCDNNPACMEAIRK